MIPRQRRITIALLLAACVPVLTVTAQTPQKPATAKDVILSTKTPLGEASIVAPKGTELDDPIGDEKEITRVISFSSPIGSSSSVPFGATIDASPRGVLVDNMTSFAVAGFCGVCAVTVSTGTHAARRRAMVMRRWRGIMAEASH